MRIIRYDSLVVGSHDQCGVLRLSDCDDCRISTWELGKIMLDKAKAWIIEGYEPFKQINALYELLKYLNENEKNVFIHIKSYTYSYMTLRSASTTDEILDMCDILTDINGIPIDLRAMAGGSNLVYLEVSDE